MTGDRVTEIRERVERNHKAGYGALLVEIADLRYLLDELAKRDKALEAVRKLHRKSPIYDTYVEDCPHDFECEGVECSDGYTYCPHSISDYTCSECAELNKDNMDGELPAWPCDTAAAITSALGDDQ